MRFITCSSTTRKNICPVCHAKHLPGFILAFGNFQCLRGISRKIRCIVDDKCGPEQQPWRLLHRHTEGKAGHIKYNNDFCSIRGVPRIAQMKARVSQRRA